jgi:hypothetical protein
VILNLKHYVVSVILNRGMPRRTTLPCRGELPCLGRYPPILRKFWRVARCLCSLLFPASHIFNRVAPWSNEVSRVRKIYTIATKYKIFTRQNQGGGGHYLMHLEKIKWMDFRGERVIVGGEEEGFGNRRRNKMLVGCGWWLCLGCALVIGAMLDVVAPRSSALLIRLQRIHNF